MKDISKKNTITDTNPEYQKFIDIFNQSPVSTGIYNTEGKLENINQAYLDLFGIQKPEALNRFKLFTFSPITEKIKADIRSGIPSKFEFDFDFDLAKRQKRYEITRSGKCYFECFINPMIAQDHTIVGYIIQIIEITDRKRAEHILLESEFKYRSLIHHSSDPIFSFNPDETYRFVNEAFARHFKKEPEDIIGKTPHDIFSYEEAEKRLTLVRKVFRNGQKGEIEVKVVTPTGDVHYFLTMADPIKNEQGEVIYVTCVSKDITKRKVAEEALSITEEKFRRIVENSLSGMYFYYLDHNDQLIFNGANPAADKIMGLSHESLMGKTIEETFPNLANTNVPAKFRSIAKGELDAQEFEINYQEGTISGFYSVQVFQTESNTITVHFTDISERKKTETLLKQQAAELQKINTTKDKFFSIIAHDLKSPFNAIIGFTDLLLTNFNHLDEATLLKGIRTIESASSQAYKLLENLLLWAQNQTGRGQYNPEKLNLNRQIRESIHYIESTAINKGIRIINNVKTDYHILADKNMIDTILRNLISNAIKFSYSGSNIIISAIELDGEVNVSVSDNGTGIAPGKLSAIFEIDKRTNTVGTENEQGTGFGLVLCKDFIDRQGGNIWVESTLGKGSTFTFSFPLH